MTTTGILKQGQVSEGLVLWGNGSVQYRPIAKLVKLLPQGVKLKADVDDVIDRNKQLFHVRDAVLELKAKHDSEKDPQKQQGIKRLAGFWVFVVFSFDSLLRIRQGGVCFGFRLIVRRSSQRPRRRSRCRSATGLEVTFSEPSYSFASARSRGLD